VTVSRDLEEKLWRLSNNAWCLRFLLGNFTMLALITHAMALCNEANHASDFMRFPRYGGDCDETLESFDPDALYFVLIGSNVSPDQIAETPEQVFEMAEDATTTRN
jgi:hypothetical protein